MMEEKRKKVRKPEYIIFPILYILAIIFRIIGFFTSDHLFYTFIALSFFLLIPMVFSKYQEIRITGPGGMGVDIKQDKNNGGG
jgi:hypothetical membrane protein